MTLNFRATGIQADKLIASGSSGTSTGAKLVIYPIAADETGTPNQGYIDQTIFATGSVGTDIFLFVSGGVGERGTAGAQSITTFGGDVHISGNISVDGGLPGQEVYWISNTENQIYTTGSATVTGSLINGLSGSTVGLYSHAEGLGSIVSGAWGHGEGEGTLVVGQAAHAEGYQTTASGDYSHAEGSITVVSGYASHAEGDSTVTTTDAYYSHAEGSLSNALGVASHAEGYNTQALADYSHSEGERTLSAGKGSHAVGFGTRASSNWSHAEGYLTTSSADYSHAEGANTVTVGLNSHAEGFWTIASGSNQHVAGKYNTRSNDFSIFIIGDGTGSLNSERSDIVRVNSGSTPGIGRVEVTGSVVATIGLSGSHTTLKDGTRFLVAGTNITINTASNGSVEISGSAGTEFLPSLTVCAGFDDFTDPAFPGWDVYRRGDKVLSGSGDSSKLMHFTNITQFSALTGSGIAILTIPSASSPTRASSSIAMCRLGEGMALDAVVPVVTEWRFAPLTASLPTFTLCDTKTMWALGVADFDYLELSDNPGINTVAMLATVVTGVQIYQLIHFSGSTPYASVEFPLPVATSSYLMRLSVLSGSSTLEIGADDGAFTVSKTLSGTYAPSASLYTPWIYHGQGGTHPALGIDTGYDRFLAIDYVGWSGKRAATHAAPATYNFTVRNYENLLPGSTRDRRIEFTAPGDGATESLSRQDQMVRVSHNGAVTASLLLPDSANRSLFVIKKANSYSTGSIYLIPIRDEAIEGITGSRHMLTGSDAIGASSWTVWSDGQGWWVA